MYPEALYPKTKQVLESLASAAVLDAFYLAGGTALALQVGHRKSIDLDFFAVDFPKRELLLQELAPFGPKIIQEAAGTLDTYIADVKVSFLQYKYVLLNEPVMFNNVKLASVLDIACMKLSAISSRGTKKDFVDLYYVLKKYPLESILSAFEKKFAGVSYQRSSILKSLVYFDDAQADPEPDYLTATDWAKVQTAIIAETQRLLY